MPATASLPEALTFGVPCGAGRTSKATHGYMLNGQAIPMCLQRVKPVNGDDMTTINGQEHVKRALEVAAAGSHNMMMAGPPGAGKTLIAHSMPSILPRLTVDEALDITRVYSVADALPWDEPLMRHRLFRAPHHTISYSGLIGGGRWPKTQVRDRSTGCKRCWAHLFCLSSLCDDRSWRCRRPHNRWWQVFGWGADSHQG